MKKIFSLCTTAFCAVFSLFAQSPAIEWQETLGGNSQNALRSIHQTSDGGYILGGISDSNISNDKTENCLGTFDYWVVKLDVDRNIQWQNTIGSNLWDDFYCLHQTKDGGYIIGGSSNGNASGDKTENSLGDSDYWIVKLDTTGGIQWQNTIGGDTADFFTCLQQTSDGGYILGGRSASSMSGDKTENSWGDMDFWVVKLNAGGAIQQPGYPGLLGGEVRCRREHPMAKYHRRRPGR